MEVVGVVPGLRHDLFDKAPVAHVYVPFGRQFRSGMNVHLRAAGTGPAAEAAVLQAARREIRAVDERLPVLGLKTMAQFRDASVFYWVVKAGAWLFAVFGAVAVFLAVVGLYAVKAYVVARRTREIGIRMALGSIAARRAVDGAQGRPGADGGRPGRWDSGSRPASACWWAACSTR